MARFRVTQNHNVREECRETIKVTTDVRCSAMNHKAIASYSIVSRISEVMYNGLNCWGGG